MISRRSLLRGVAALPLLPAALAAAHAEPQLVDGLIDIQAIDADGVTFIVDDQFQVEWRYEAVRINRGTIAVQVIP